MIALADKMSICDNGTHSVIPLQTNKNHISDITGAVTALGPPGMV